MRSGTPPSILFVCMGNICRSPLAEGIVRDRARRAGVALELDSAGTHAYHVGEPPDPRARAVARRFGCDIDGLRARQVVDDDFHRFDLILAADRSNLGLLMRRRPATASAELALLAEWCRHPACTEVPDPYYDGDEAFETVCRLLEGCADGLLRRLAKPA
jgi:protein-tyrosine phosphatase